MATIKAEYYNFGGINWDLYYFKTSADLIVETASYKVLTADERSKITEYLTTFNAANKLAQIESGGKLPVGIIPPLAYLPTSGGTVTGQIFGTSIQLSGLLKVSGLTYINGNIASDNGNITFQGLDYVDFNQAVLSSVADPIYGTDAANKQYVDAKVSAGMRPIDAVKCATTSNITTSGLVTIDGYTLQAGDRVLVWKQTIATDNGVYVAGSGLWSKVINDSKQGAFVFVENGTTHNDWFFHANSDTTWIIHSRIDTILNGAGLSKSGNTLSIANSGVTNAMLAGSIAWSKFSNESANDNSVAAFDTWAELSSAGTSKSLSQHLSMIMAAIGLLRGTANYNTGNTETISGAYLLANSKARIEMGTAIPTVTAGKNPGDLYFRELSRS